MEDIFDFIEDACEALDLLSRFYRISYDKSKEIYDNEGRMIDDGITEEIGWSEGDIYNTIENDEGITYTFNDACEHLTEKYEENIDAFIDMGEETGAHFISLLESKFLTIDEMQRIALIRKIVRTSFAFFYRVIMYYMNLFKKIVHVAYLNIEILCLTTKRRNMKKKTKKGCIRLFLSLHG